VLRQIALIAVFAAMPALTFAQDVRQIEPTWRVVTRDGVPLRCGPQSVFYSVAEFNTGRMLLVDGEAGDQARVRYPDDLTVMVPADEARAVNDTTVELVRASALRAPSTLLGLSGSWKALFEADLPAGTRLTVRETLKNDRGQVVGYRVVAPAPPVAPAPARAFVALDALRDATDAEIAKHLGSRPATEPVMTEPAVQPPPVQQPGNQPAQPAAEPTTQPATQQPAAQPESRPATEPDTSLMEPMVEPTAPEPEANATQIQASTLETLEASFAAARQLPPEQLDDALEELLAEFGRTRAETDDDERLAAQLDMRIEWLKLRIATRDQRRAIQAALSTANERSAALDNQVATWRKGRPFQLVGRLVVSNVYNGERLPKMYRIQTVSRVDGSPRTLGYVTPDASLDGKLGSVVGIVGEPRFDPQLRLVIVRPDQVDVMPE
tara:strand:- start:13652 stop:14965 length:1314 start_codon:yes stop_codon:yes gene_type:complete